MLEAIKAYHINFNHEYWQPVLYLTQPRAIEVLFDFEKINVEELNYVALHLLEIDEMYSERFVSVRFQNIKKNYRLNIYDFLDFDKMGVIEGTRVFIRRFASRCREKE